MNDTVFTVRSLFVICIVRSSTLAEKALAVFVRPDPATNIEAPEKAVKTRRSLPTINGEPTVMNPYES
jgi:hypothetical protein